MKENIKNWKWWVVLPIAVPWLLLACIPKFAILILEFMVRCIEHFNFGDKKSALLDYVVNWVQRDYEK